MDIETNARKNLRRRCSRFLLYNMHECLLDEYTHYQPNSANKHSVISCRRTNTNITRSAQFSLNLFFFSFQIEYIRQYHHFNFTNQICIFLSIFRRNFNSSKIHDTFEMTINTCRWISITAVTIKTRKRYN